MSCRSLPFWVIVTLWTMLPGTILAEPQIGIYFDSAGTQNEITSTVPGEIHTVYLILHDDQAPSYLEGWECRVSVVGSGHLSNWEFAGQGTNYLSLPELHVLFEEPLTTSSTTILATAQLHISQPEDSAWVFLSSIGNPSTEPVSGDYPDFRPAVHLDWEWQSMDILPGGVCESAATANPGQSIPPLDLTQIPQTVETDLNGYGTLILANLGQRLMLGILRRVSGDVHFWYGGGAPGMNEIPIYIPPGSALPVSIRQEGELLLEVCGQEVRIFCNSWGGVLVEPEEFNLGVVYLPEESQHREFTFTNVGSEPYEFILSSTPFLQVEIDQNPLAAGESRTGYFEFRPTETGNTHEQIRFYLPEQDWEVAIHIFAEVLPNPSVSPETLEFGTHSVGYPATESLTITNHLPVLVEGVVADFAPESPFRIIHGLGSYELSQGESHPIEIRFDPKHDGIIENEVNLGLDLEPYLVRGVGALNPPLITVSPDTVFWGGVYTQPFSVNRSLQIFNTGPSHYRGRLVLDGTGFSISDSLIVLPPALAGVIPNNIIQVEFSPPGIGFYRGNISFDPDIGINIPLEGKSRGVEPSLEYNPSPVHFGYVTAGQTPTITLEMANPEGGQYVGLAELTSWSEAFSFPENQSNIAIGSGQTHSIDITFSSSEGAHGGRLVTTSGTRHSIRLSAFSGQGPNPFQAGIFFDEGTFSQNEIKAAPGDTVTAFLVAFPDTLYLHAWDICLDITGDNEFLGIETPEWEPFELGGGICKYIRPWGEAWYAGEQVLAEIRFVVQCSDCQTTINIFPHPGSVLGEDSVFWVADWAPFGSIAAVQAIPIHGHLPAATINPQSLSVEQEGEISEIPVRTAFHGCFPNPFNPQTTFNFDLATETEVNIEIFDLAGRRVKHLVNKKYLAGTHQISWQGGDDQGRRLASGTYLVRTLLGDELTLTKVSLLK